MSGKLLVYISICVTQIYPTFDIVAATRASNPPTLNSATAHGGDSTSMFTPRTPSRGRSRTFCAGSATTSILQPMSARLYMANHCKSMRDEFVRRVLSLYYFFVFISLLYNTSLQLANLHLCRPSHRNMPQQLLPRCDAVQICFPRPQPVRFHRLKQLGCLHNCRCVFDVCVLSGCNLFTSDMVSHAALLTLC